MKLQIPCLIANPSEERIAVNDAEQGPTGRRNLAVPKTYEIPVLVEPIYLVKIERAKKHHEQFRQRNRKKDRVLMRVGVFNLVRLKTVAAVASQRVGGVDQAAMGALFRTLHNCHLSL